MPRHGVTRVASIVLAGAALSCRALEPTIAQRQQQVVLPREAVHTSLADDYPEELEGASESLDGQHLDSAVPYVAPKIGGDERVQVEFRGAPLSQVVHFLADQARVNLYVDASFERTVDVSFPSITIGDALSAVLERNGLRLIESPQGVYSIERHDGNEAASASFTLQSVRAEDVQPNLQALVSSASALVVDPRQNLVVVNGSQRDVDRVREYLERADRLQRQVLIEVRILEVSLGDQFQLGLDLTVDGTLDGHVLGLAQTLQTADDDFTFSFTSRDGDVDSTINAIRRYAGTDLLSSPRVLAVSGTEASIEVIREVPYVNVTSTTSGTTGGVGTSVVEEVQFKEAGIKLKVTPLIQEGGAIAIHIDQELSEVVDVFNDIPVIDKRFLKTDLIVDDRATVVLGGLMQDKRSEVDKGVPGLMDLPLIGRLFRQDDDDSSKRELLVFLTPRVVDSREARRLTQTFRRAYSERVRETGVRSHAEAETPKK